jgi:hypothetical protein
MPPWQALHILSTKFQANFQVVKANRKHNLAVVVAAGAQQDSDQI